MAAPHVAGAWAILKQKTPNATVDEILTQFQQTGVPITDERYGTGIAKPRIDVGSALGIEYPVPVLDSIAPSTTDGLGPGVHAHAPRERTSPGRPAMQVNGVIRPTTYVNETTLTATVPASDLATTASGLSIAVFSPPPAGGTSAARTLSLVQPSLTVSPTTVQAGGPGDGDADERAGGRPGMARASRRSARPTARTNIPSGSTSEPGSRRARGR